MLVDLDRKHRGRADRLGDSNRKQADRPAARDGHALGSNLAGQNRVYRIAQRIENRRVIQWNRGIELPDIRFRNHHVFGERPIGVDADDLHLLADVRFARAALQAFAAGDVHFGGNKIAFLHARNFVAERGHLAAKFMPRNQRRMNAVLRPAIPVVNVQIGSADRGYLHLDQYIAAPEGRNLYLADVRSGRCFRFDDRQHCCSHMPPMNSQSKSD